MQKCNKNENQSQWYWINKLNLVKNHTKKTKVNIGPTENILDRSEKQSHFFKNKRE